MTTFKKVNRFADRGKKSEDAVAKALTAWHQHPTREFNRMVDAKAAGRIIKAAAADFEFFCVDEDNSRHFGLIEVKETEHEYRLSRDKVPQLARMRKRTNCGGLCVVLVHHSTLGLWRALDVRWLAANGDKGSWNVGDAQAFAAPYEALTDFAYMVFP